MLSSRILRSCSSKARTSILDTREIRTRRFRVSFSAPSWRAPKRVSFSSSMPRRYSWKISFGFGGPRKRFGTVVTAAGLDFLLALRDSPPPNLLVACTGKGSLAMAGSCVASPFKGSGSCTTVACTGGVTLETCKVSPRSVVGGRSAATRCLVETCALGALGLGAVAAPTRLCGLGAQTARASPFKNLPVSDTKGCTLGNEPSAIWCACKYSCRCCFTRRASGALLAEAGRLAPLSKCSTSIASATFAPHCNICASWASKTTVSSSWEQSAAHSITEAKRCCASWIASSASLWRLALAKVAERLSRARAASTATAGCTDSWPLQMANARSMSLIAR
mmetsp:Transcript_67665/g.188811  ORF Transcript_67665/g.188811 Transcript_67665/m.188811 type:complete len:336 (+) Transcript_67665:337-1344(+)